MTSLDFSPNRLARNGASRWATTIVGQGAKGVIAILVARYLGASAFGTFSVVWTIATIAAHYAPLGIDNLLIRELSKPSPAVDLRRALPFVSTVGGLTAAVLVAGSWWLSAESTTVEAFVAVAPYVALTAPVLVFGATFNARERMELETAVEAVEGAVSLIAAWIILSTGGGIVAVLAALSLGRVVNLAVAVVIHRFLPALPTAEVAVGLLGVVRLSIPMGGVRVLTAVIQRADIVILGLFIAADVVGVYSAAAIAVVLLADAMSELGRAAYPPLSRAHGPRDPEFRQVFDVVWRAQMVLVISATVGLAILATPVATMVFGDDFAASGPLLAVLAMGLILRTLGNFVGIALYALGRQWNRFMVTGVAATVKVVACVATIPFFGVWGAVWATVATDAVYLVAMLWVSRDFRGSVAAGFPAAGMIAAIVGAVAALIPGTLFLKVGAGVIAFALLMRLGPGPRLLRQARSVSSPRIPWPDVVRIGPLHVRLEGEADLPNDVVPRSLGQLPPFAGDALIHHVVRFDRGVTAVGSELYGHPLVVSSASIGVHDHAGRAATLARPDGGQDWFVTIDPRIDVHTFQTWIQLPWLRLALYEQGGTLARLTVVDVDGWKVAIVGPSATGKTRVASELLARGAALVGDDWVVVHAEEVAAACSLVVVRDQVRRRTIGVGLMGLLRHSVVVSLARLARWTSRWRRVSLICDRVSTLAWRWGTEVVDVARVHPGARVATLPGSIDHVVVLGDGGAVNVDELALMVAARATIDLPSAAVVESALAMTGATGTRPRLPTIDEDRRSIASAFAHARIDSIAFGGRDEDVATTVDFIARCASASRRDLRSSGLEGAS